MNKKLKNKINSFLEKKGWNAEYSFQKGKKERKKNFIIRWVNYYSTPITISNTQKKLFLKILINPKLYKEMKDNIRYFKKLSKVKFSNFIIPKLLDFSLNKQLPYYITEYIDGELLGFYDKPKDKFAKKEIIEKILKGLQENKKIPVKNKKLWSKNKDFSWMQKNIISKIEDKKGFKFSKFLPAKLLEQTLSLVQKYKNNISIKYVPLWGDPAPNNFLIKNSKVYLIDLSPYILGNQYSDLAEFISFTYFSKKWKKADCLLNFSSTSNEQLFRLNLIIYLSDRVRTFIAINKQKYIPKAIKKWKENLNWFNRV